MKEAPSELTAKLMVVEDDVQVAESLLRGLREAGYAVETAGRLASADGR